MALDPKYFKTHKQTHFNNEVFTGADYYGLCDGASYRVDQELFVFIVRGPEEKSGDGHL